MALATLVYIVGNGMFMVVSVLYFTRIVGLGATQVGLGLTIAGLFGLLAGVPLGHLGDRVGPRELLIGLLVLSAPVFAALARVTSWWQFVVVASLATSLDRGSAAVRSGLIASSEHGADRIRARAYARAVPRALEHRVLTRGPARAVGDCAAAHPLRRHRMGGARAALRRDRPARTSGRRLDGGDQIALRLI